MKIRADEITSVLRKEIEKYEPELRVEEEGTIIEVGDGIARIYGLEKAAAGEMLEFENGVRAQVFNLEEGPRVHEWDALLAHRVKLWILCWMRSW